jgi:hypothetical protein
MYLPNFFRLDQLIREFSFIVNEKETEKNKRFRLIELRWQGEPEFRGFKLIPSIERYIRNEIFQKYEKRRTKEELDNNYDDDDDAEYAMSGTKSLSLISSKNEIENEIEKARLEGQKFMSKIRKRIISQFKFFQAQKNFSDMIIENEVPNIK